MRANPFIAQAGYGQRAFKAISLPAAEVAGREFEACTFTGCDFHETKFIDCHFRECRFDGSNLSAIGVEGCIFSATRFEDSRLIGINWTASAWAKGRLLVPAHFVKCVLNHSLFVGLDMRGVTLSQCTAHEVDFSEAILAQANCTATDFQGSRFWHTDLSDADFSGAIHYTVPADVNTLKRTRFSLPEALSLLYSLDIILTDPDSDPGTQSEDHHPGR